MGLRNLPGEQKAFFTSVDLSTPVFETATEVFATLLVDKGRDALDASRLSPLAVISSSEGLSGLAGISFAGGVADFGGGGVDEARLGELGCIRAKLAGTRGWADGGVDTTGEFWFLRFVVVACCPGLRTEGSVQGDGVVGFEEESDCVLAQRS